MERIRIKGGKSLFGELELQGAKNSALPILAAAILCESPCIIHNCPDITDVSAAVKILEYLGCKVIRAGSSLSVDAGGFMCREVPDRLMREMRSSIIFLAPSFQNAGALCFLPGRLRARPASHRYSSLLASENGS